MTFWKKIILISLIFAFISTNVMASSVDQPSAGAMMIDIPIRMISFGLSILSSLLFVIALPFTIPSDSLDDSLEVLVMDPFAFTFQRPLGKFENWQKKKIPEQTKDAEKEQTYEPDEITPVNLQQGNV